jgi:hypothetical protein
MRAVIVTMSSLYLDALLDALCDCGDTPLAPAARRLLCAIERELCRDTPERSEIVLALPSLLGQAMPHVGPGRIRNALLVHLSVIVTAELTEQLADERLEGGEGPRQLLDRLRFARDAFACRLDPGLHTAFSGVDADVQSAAEAERQIRRELRLATFVDYERLCRRKHRSLLLAPLSLARSAGWPRTKQRALERLIETVWLALRLKEDAWDWELDWRHGGSWALCLARSLHIKSPREDRPTEPNIVRRLIMRSGVTERMNALARRKLDAGRRLAQALGMKRLAACLEQTARQARSMSPGVARTSGRPLADSGAYPVWDTELEPAILEPYTSK